MAFAKPLREIVQDTKRRQQRPPEPPVSPGGRRNGPNIWTGSGKSPSELDGTEAQLHSLRNDELALRKELDETQRMEQRMNPGGYNVTSNGKRSGNRSPQSRKEEEEEDFSPEDIEEALQTALKDLMDSQRNHPDTQRGRASRRSPRGSRTASHSPDRGRRSSRGSLGDDNAPVIRSPMYRSASPSRKKRPDGVLMTSWPQAPRFKNEKTWIPGPGKYNVPSSTFEPAQFPAEEDFEGLFGHTWEDYQKKLGSQHKESRNEPNNAMENVTRATGDMTDRERETRRENIALRRQLSEQRLQASQRESQLRSDIERLHRDHERKAQQLEILHSKLQGCKNGFQKIQGAVHALNAVLDAKAFEINRRALSEIRGRANVVAERVADIVETIHPAQPAEPSSWSIGFQPKLRHTPDLQSNSPGQSAGYGETFADMPEHEVSRTQNQTESSGYSAIANFAQKAKRASMAVQAREREFQSEESRNASLRAQFGGGAERVEWTQRAPSRNVAMNNEHFYAPLSTKSSSRPSTARRRTPSPAKTNSQKKGELTVDEKLRKVYDYYSYSPDDRLMQNSGLRSSQFFKLLRDGGVLDNRVSYADIDVIFARVCTKSTSGLLSYDDFVTALTEVAMRKYKDDEEQAHDNIRPQNLRRLLKRHILPLYDVVGEGRAEDLLNHDGFAAEFLKDSTIDWFNQHGPSLQYIFNKYAMSEGPQGDNTHTLGQTDWTQVQEALSHISERQCVQFCKDYKIIPNLLRRPQVVSLYRDAAQLSDKDGNEQKGLSFPFFVEFIAMVAYHVYTDIPEGSTGAHMLPTHGGICTDMCAKLDMLFYTLHDLGAAFSDTEENKMLKKVQRSMRQRLNNSEQMSREKHQDEDRYNHSRVQDVLMEKAL